MSIEHGILAHRFVDILETQTHIAQSRRDARYSNAYCIDARVARSSDDWVQWAVSSRHIFLSNNSMFAVFFLCWFPTFCIRRNAIHGVCVWVYCHVYYVGERRWVYFSHLNRHIDNFKLFRWTYIVPFMHYTDSVRWLSTDGQTPSYTADAFGWW